MSYFNRPSLSPAADTALFIGVLVVLGIALVTVYPRLTPTAPDSWTAVAEDNEGEQAPSERESLVGTWSMTESHVLHGNILDGSPAVRYAKPQFSVPELSRGSKSVSNGSDGAGARWETHSSPWNAGRGIASSGGTGGSSTGWSTGATSRSANGSPSGGGLARELAASSGELRTLERQVGALHDQVNRHFGPSPNDATVSNENAWLEGASAAMMAPENHTNPPLPSDPIPVDGGLALLLTAGVSYGIWRLHMI